MHSVLYFLFYFFLINIFKASIIVLFPSSIDVQELPMLPRTANVYGPPFTVPRNRSRGNTPSHHVPTLHISFVLFWYSLQVEFRKHLGTYIVEVPSSHEKNSSQMISDGKWKYVHIYTRNVSGNHISVCAYN